MLRKKVHTCKYRDLKIPQDCFGVVIDPTSGRFGVSIVPSSCYQASAVCWSDSPTSLALGARPVSCMAVSISESDVSLPSPPVP